MDKSPQAKQAKIVKLNKLTKPTLIATDDDDDYITPVIANLNQDTSKIASIRKLPKITSSLSESSFDTSSSILDDSDDDNNVIRDHLTRLHVIKNHFGQLAYGFLNVKLGECVYLVSETDNYCFVENDQGIQGLVPKDVFINLDEFIRKSKSQYISSNCKITSL